MRRVSVNTKHPSTHKINQIVLCIKGFQWSMSFSLLCFIVCACVCMWEWKRCERREKNKYWQMWFVYTIHVCVYLQSRKHLLGLKVKDTCKLIKLCGWCYWMSKIVIGFWRCSMKWWWEEEKRDGEGKGCAFFRDLFLYFLHWFLDLDFLDFLWFLKKEDKWDQKGG